MDKIEYKKVYTVAYDIGYEDAKKGLFLRDNPYTRENYMGNLENDVRKYAAHFYYFGFGSYKEDLHDDYQHS